MPGVILITAQRLLLGKISPIPRLRPLPTGRAAKNRETSSQATAILPFYLSEGFKTNPVHCPKTR